MKNILLITLVGLALSANAQRDWSTIDFMKEGKVDTKGIGKSFKSNPVFINDYYIMQASMMKGSSKSGVMQKQGVGAVFSDASLAGVSAEALQSLIDDLHTQFIQELKNAGLNIVDGEALLQTDYVQSKKSDKKVMAGKTDGNVIYDKLGGTDANSYDIKEVNYFRPKDKNIFTTSATISGNFYGKLAAKEKVTLMSIGYIIRFASFEGSKTVSKNKLTTRAGLSVIPAIMIYNPSGSFSWIAFKQHIYGNNEWSNGLIEIDSRDGSYWGLSSKGKYAIEADEAKYIAELRSLISNMQKGIANHIKSEI
jgi:hypothetical protein